MLPSLSIMSNIFDFGLKLIQTFANIGLQLTFGIIYSFNIHLNLQWNQPQISNHLLNIFTLTDCLIDGIKQSFSELKSHILIENVLSDQITQKTSKIFNADVVLVNVEILDQHIRIIAQYDVDYVELRIIRKLLLLRQKSN